MSQPTTIQTLPAAPTYAWFTAMVNDNLPLMDDLLAHGVPVDVPHPLRHTTALMEATRRGNTATVHWLLAHGATPAFLCGTPQGTPLHCALRLHYWGIAALLIQAAPSLNMVDEAGRTPLHMLASEAVDCLNTQDLETLVDRLVEKSCPLDALDREGVTALHYAALLAHGPLAELLLAKGADPNIAAIDRGVTPLTIVAIDRNSNLAAMLMRYGANAYQPMTDGRTPAIIYPAIASMQAGLPVKGRAISEKHAAAREAVN